MTDSKTEAAEMERLAEEKWLEEIQRLSEINLIPGNSYNLDVYAKIRIAKMYATIQSRNELLEEDWKRMRAFLVRENTDDFPDDLTQQTDRTSLLLSLHHSPESV